MITLVLYYSGSWVGLEVSRDSSEWTQILTIVLKDNEALG